MKRWKHAWLELACTAENLELAYKRAAKNSHRKTKSLKRYADPAERERLAQELLSGTWVMKPGVKIYRTDKYTGKVREIIAPNFETKLIEHAIVQTFEEELRKHFVQHTIASVKNGGTEYGRKYLRYCAKHGGKKVRYYVKWDIKSYFPSINIDVAMSLYAKHIHDMRMLKLIRVFLTNNTDRTIGIPLGSYLSQWTANLYLSNIDHYIKEKERVKYAMTQLDDRVAFFSSKRKAQRFIKTIKLMIKDTRDMEVKTTGPGMIMINKWNEVPLNMLCYRTRRNGSQILRRGIYLSLTRMLNRIEKKGHASVKQARSILSRKGIVQHSDCVHLYNRVIYDIFKYHLKGVAKC